MDSKFVLSKAKPNQYGDIGKLMVNVYSQLKGFPSPNEQPKYYQMLANIGNYCENQNVELIIALSHDNEIAGGVVYIDDMSNYGSGGTATTEKNASGFRLLAVDAQHRGRGIGKLLINKCIEKAIRNKHEQVIIHSTKAMTTAWSMYEKLGFKRSQDLDFMQDQLAVFGFRLNLKKLK